jgi:hypothetical protein
VKVVYNPLLNTAFDTEVSLLQKRHGKKAFAANWKNEKGASGNRRREIHRMLETMAAPNKDPEHPNVTFLMTWHTTGSEKLESIFETGFANLAELDEGFFGKGLYSAGEARYSWTVYGPNFKEPVLLMNWVSFYSAYIVIHGDKSLVGAPNVGNHDAHFVIVEQEGNSLNFYPPRDLVEQEGNLKPQYSEVVVFNSAQFLPRALVELQSDLLPSLPDVEEAELKAQDYQAQKAKAMQKVEQAEKLKAQQEAAEQAQKQAEAIEKEKARVKLIEDKQAAIAKAEAEKRESEQSHKGQKPLKEKPSNPAAARNAAAGQVAFFKTQNQPNQNPEPPPLQAQGFFGKLFRVLGVSREEAPSADPEDIREITVLLKRGKQKEIQGKLDQNPVLAKSIELFLLFVAARKKDQCEAMLKANRGLAEARGTFTDLSGCTFEKITGFQYAFLRLDFHMWNMIYKMEALETSYLKREQAHKQIEAALMNKKWIGPQATATAKSAIEKWISMLETCDKEFPALIKCKNFAAMQQMYCDLGSAQLFLPVHVIDEWCREDRSFDKSPPNFLEEELPRSMKIDPLKFWFSMRNSEKEDNANVTAKFAILRGYFLKPTKLGGENIHNPPTKVLQESRLKLFNIDLAVAVVLLETRLQQAKQLVLNLKIGPDVAGVLLEMRLGQKELVSHLTNNPKPPGPGR